MRLLATLIVGTSALSSWAMVHPPSTQEPKPEAKRIDGAGKPGNPTEVTEADSFLATWLVVANKTEIELATLAQQKATDPMVKQFAQKVAEDHRLFLQKLQPFASADLRNATGATGRPEDDSRALPASSRVDKGDFDHATLFQELGAKCLQTARKELDQKQGAEFDKSYMMMALGSHSAANDMLTVFQGHSSPALKSILGDGQRTVASHLQMAKDYCGKMSGHDAIDRDREREDGK